MKKFAILLAALLMAVLMPLSAFAAAGDTQSGDTGNGNTQAGDSESGAEKAVYPAVVNEDGRLVYYASEGVPDMSDGWKKDADGVKAFYVKKGKVLAKTAAKINERLYYFDSKGRLDKSGGWKKGADGRKAYYIKKGKLLAGVVKKINGKLYYFRKNGSLDKSDGWKKVSGDRYYVKSGKIVTKATAISTTKKVRYYYNRNTRKWQSEKIRGAKTKYVTESVDQLYMFLPNGKLCTKAGLFRVKGSEYYGLGKGLLKTGWLALETKNGRKYEKAMYFYESGSRAGTMAKNTKIKYLKIPENGRLGKAYYLGIRKLDSIGWSLRNAYNWSSNMKYQGRKYRAKDSETYAVRGFTYGSGNCYCMAGTFYIMAKLLGYDVHQVEGKVDLPHSWTVIKQNGREWVYDPNFTNETGRNGWKIYYGQKGTWKYNHYHKMN